MVDLIVQFSEDGCFWASSDGEPALQEIESHVAECVRGKSVSCVAEVAEV